MRHGFTIVELLVVITIIVILLALLVPAMDQAIYQAELATCSARLNAINRVFVAYATGHRRAYPERHASAGSTPVLLYYSGQGGNMSPAGVNRFDDRPPLREMFGDLKAVQCPLAGTVDLTTQRSTHVFTSYTLFYGWGYAGQPKKKLRMGDLFSWDRREHGLLGGDMDWYGAVPYSYSAHPDADGILAQQRYSETPVVDPQVPDGAYTWSYWNAYPGERGAVDLNFTYEDGSVSRIEEVAWGHLNDERMASVPAYAGGTTWPGEGMLIPMR